MNYDKASKIKHFNFLWRGSRNDSGKWCRFGPKRSEEEETAAANTYTARDAYRIGATIPVL